MTVSYGGEKWQIKRDGAPARLEGREVVVEEQLDGTARMRIGDRYLQIEKLPQRADKEAQVRDRPKRWEGRVVLPPKADHPRGRSYKGPRQPLAAAAAPAPLGNWLGETIPSPFASSVDMSVLFYPRTFSFYVDICHLRT